jgi:hypothetical protein
MDVPGTNEADRLGGDVRTSSPHWPPTGFCISISRRLYFCVCVFVCQPLAVTIHSSRSP